MPCRDEGYDYEQVIAKKKAEAKVSPGYLLCEACSLLEELCVLFHFLSLHFFG
jgi:hypothetical protein